MFEIGYDAKKMHFINLLYVPHIMDTGITFTFHFMNIFQTKTSFDSIKIDILDSATVRK